MTDARAIGPSVDAERDTGADDPTATARAVRLLEADAAEGVFFVVTLRFEDGTISSYVVAPQDRGGPLGPRKRPFRLRTG